MTGYILLRQVIVFTEQQQAELPVLYGQILFSRLTLTLLIFLRRLKIGRAVFKRPVLKSVSGQKNCSYPSKQYCQGCGIATLAGFTIPTEDQIGYDRPATPSIGAVEYHIPTGVSNAVNTELKMMTKDKVISFTGLSGVSPIAVYGLTGNLLHQSLVGNNQEISLDHLSDNLVIVRIDNKSFKAFLK